MGYNTAISQGDEIWTAITVNYYINSIIAKSFYPSCVFAKFRILPMLQLQHQTTQREKMRC